MSMRSSPVAAVFLALQLAAAVGGAPLLGCSKSTDDGAGTGTGGTPASGTGGHVASGGSSGSGGAGTGGLSGGGGAGTGGASGSGGQAAGGAGGSGSDDAAAGASDTSTGGAAGAPDGSGGSDDGGNNPPPGGGPFALTSSVVEAKGTIPVKYRCGTPNVSPPLSWGVGPAGTLSYAVTLLHTTSVHWVLWDIPTNVTSLPEGIAREAMPAVPPGSKQAKPGLDGSTWFGYTGPCPSGANTHYEYNVYALPVAKLEGVTTDSAATAVNAAILKIKALATAQMSVMAAK